MSLQSEAVMAARINAKGTLKGFIKNPDAYGSYDYFNEDFLLELKDRGTTSYLDTMLEDLKLQRLTEDATKMDKHWVFGVQDTKGIHLFDEGALEGLEPVYKSCPETSEFGRRQYVDKLVYLVPFDRAFEMIPKEVTNVN